MEEYLRPILLFVAAIIICMIFLEAWRTHRRHRLERLADKYMSTHTPDEVLGLVERKEPVMETCHSALAVEAPELDEPVAETTATAETPTSPAPSKPEKSMADLQRDLLAVHVHARNNTTFSSYDLLQAISATGMQFGDMNIFHYLEDTQEGRVTWFSLASATKPGYFDLDKIGDFSCVGLTLFTDLQQVPNPQHAFDLMLETAEQLAEDLDGELRANPRTPWTPLVMQQYQQKVARYLAPNVL